MGISVRKYDFTGEVKKVGNRVLHRIVAVRNIDGVAEGTAGGGVWKIKPVVKGTVGGWIERDDNLSHCGRSWVADDAMVMDDVYIRGNARVEKNAKCFGFSTIGGDAIISTGGVVNAKYRRGHNLIVDGDYFILVDFTLSSEKSLARYNEILKNIQKERAEEIRRQRIRLEIGTARSTLAEYKLELKQEMSMLSGSMYHKHRSDSWKAISRFRCLIYNAEKRIIKLENPVEWANMMAERERELAAKKIAGVKLTEDENLEALDSMIYEASKGVKSNVVVVKEDTVGVFSNAI